MKGGSLDEALGSLKSGPSAEAGGDELEDAMSDLGEALADKDWAAAAAAFRRAKEVCGDDYDDEDEIKE